jgi:hypothetical protein
VRGYPVFTQGGKQYLLSRFVYGLLKGNTKGLVVRHTCDNPLCINPDHLLIGTHNDNVQDKVNRGRQAKGTHNGRSKLTEPEVIDIFYSKNKI